MDDILILEARKGYHKALINSGLLSITADGIASNADGSNQPSKSIAKIVAERIGAPTAPKVKGQTAGTLFEQITMKFVADTFPSYR